MKRLLSAVLIAFLTIAGVAEADPAGVPPGLRTVSLNGHANPLDSWWLAEPVTVMEGKLHDVHAVFGWRMYSWGAIVDCEAGRISWQPRGDFVGAAVPHDVLTRVAQVACAAPRYVLLEAGWRRVTSRP